MADDEPPGHDLRMPLLGAATWGGALAGLLLAPAQLVGAALLAGLGLGLGLVRRRRSDGLPLLLVAAFLVAVTGATVAGIRVARVADGPVTSLAARGASVTVRVQVASDVRVVTGRYADLAVARGTTVTVSTPSTSVHTRAPVLLLGDADTMGDVRLGQVVDVHGRLEPADDRELAARLRVLGPPTLVAAPAWWWRGAERVRAALRRSVSGVAEPARTLVPALVVGDDAGLAPEVADDFRTTGLTHLLAVSGTNLTLLVGFLLWLARWVGVRGRWSYPVGAGAIVGFVLLARPEPSVLRAAVMGSVGLVALGGAGGRRGGRALGVAVTVVLLVDPWLATSAGFALSALATAGIVFVAPAWRDALASWMPRWAAEAIAVPSAAQLACTPVVVALSGQVSLVAVAANLLAAPAVGPATVLGLAGGLLTLVAPPPGAVAGHLAGGCVRWIVWVAERGAGLPAPALAWGSGPVALALVTVLSVALLLAAPRLLRRRRRGLAAGLALLAAIGLPGVRLWPGARPPEGWLMVACDVGQGDGLVLNAGGGAAVVVDAGPDPALMDACLRRLGVRSVPLVVLTHFHADHVSGLSGVLRDRSVGGVEVTGLAAPTSGVAEVAREAADAGLAVRVAVEGHPEGYGDVTLQVLSVGSETAAAATDAPDDGEGSAANNASVVLLAEVRGVRILLTGDIEPEAQARLARVLPGLRVDVLKVPHHGSARQDLGWLTSLDARIALISVGADNDYGHPSPDVLAALTGEGTTVLRTDLAGDLVVALVDGRLVTGPDP